MSIKTQVNDVRVDVQCTIDSEFTAHVEESGKMWNSTMWMTVLNNVRLRFPHLITRVKRNGDSFCFELMYPNISEAARNLDTDQHYVKEAVAKEIDVMIFGD